MANLTQELRTPQLDQSTVDGSRIPSTGSVFAASAEDIAKLVQAERAGNIQEKALGDIDIQAEIAAEELVGPAVQPEVEDFAQWVTRIGQGVKQGSMTSAEGQVRMQAKLREYTKRYPRLASELRAAANPVIALHTNQLQLAEKANNEAGKRDQKILEQLQKWGMQFGLNPIEAQTNPVAYANKLEAWMDITHQEQKLQYIAALRNDIKGSIDLEQAGVNLEASKFRFWDDQTQVFERQKAPLVGANFYANINTKYGRAIVQAAGLDPDKATLADLSDQQIVALSKDPAAAEIIRNAEEELVNMQQTMQMNLPTLSGDELKTAMAAPRFQVDMIKGLLSGDYTNTTLKRQNELSELLVTNGIYNSAIGSRVLNLKAMSSLLPDDGVAKLFWDSKGKDIAAEITRDYIPILIDAQSAPSREVGATISNQLSKISKPEVQQAAAHTFSNAITQAAAIKRQGGPTTPEQEAVLNTGRNALYGLAIAIKNGVATDETYETFINTLQNPLAKDFLVNDEVYGGVEMAADMRANLSNYIARNIKKVQERYQAELGKTSEYRDYLGISDKPPTRIVAGTGGMVELPLLSYGDMIRAKLWPDGTVSVVADPNAVNEQAAPIADRANRLMAPKINALIRAWAHVRGLSYYDAAVSVLGNTQILEDETDAYGFPSQREEVTDEAASRKGKPVK